MSASDPTPRPVFASEGEDDLLTRAEASAYLRRYGVQMKPQTLARILCTGGDGPPCEHVRRKPWYRRGALRLWAESQVDTERPRRTRRAR